MQKDEPTPLSRQAITKARELFDSGARCPEVAQSLGMTTRQFRAFRDERGWPLRSPAAPNSGRGQTGTDAARRARRIARLERTFELQAVKVERVLRHAPPDALDPVHLRMVSNLEKVLAELRRMRIEAEKNKDSAGHDHSSANDAPRELAKLRAALAKRIEELLAEETA